MAALLAQALELDRAECFSEAIAAYSALIVAATRADDRAILAEALRRRAVLSHQASDDATARAGLRQSYAVAMLLADHELAAEALNTLGGLELETGHLDAADEALTEAATLAARRPDLTARIAQNLGIVANIRGDHEEAQRQFERSLAA